MKTEVSFGGLDHRAVQHVRQGEMLLMQPSRRRAGRCSAVWRRCCFFRRRWRRFFFVLPPASGELRWDREPERAASEEADGRVQLIDVHCVMTLGDKKGTLFRVVCLDRQYKLRSPNRESMKLWVSALTQLIRQERGNAKRRCLHESSFLHGAIEARLSAKGNVVRLGDLKETLAQINIEVDDDQLREISLEFDEHGKGYLDLHEFKELCHKLAVRDTAKTVFKKFAEPLPREENMKVAAESASKAGVTVEAMSFEGFQSFVATTQDGELLDGGPPGLQAFFQQLNEPDVIEANGKRYLTELTFTKLLSSKANSLVDPNRLKAAYEDMTRPLSEYWISTSHNTYLEADQLIGMSSLEQYIDVLMRGCRCVEIDCWDGDDGEPVVTHGHTATTNVDFAGVIRVCKEHGFVKSPYPLILSLEVHCSNRQIGRMGEIMHKVLGNQLLLLAYDGSHVPDLTSPEAAQNKVIVKAKVPKHVHERWAQGSWAQQMQEEEDVDEEESDLAEDVVVIEGQKLKDRLVKASTSLKRYTPRLDHKESQPTSEEVMAKLSGYAQQIYLVAHSLTKTKGDLEGKLGQLMPCNVVSFSEGCAAKLVKHLGVEKARKHHCVHLSRVYPNAGRVDSSNFDPLPMWLAGFQLVALNYQTVDLANIMNEGKFRYNNGGCGYVLKPPPIGHGKLGAAPSQRCTVHLRVVSGHNLPRPVGVDAVLRQGKTVSSPVNPFVRVTVRGVKSDYAVKRTKRVLDNGFNPHWDEQLDFEVGVPDVAMLVFEVMHVVADLPQHHPKLPRTSHHAATEKVFLDSENWLRAHLVPAELLAAVAVPLAGAREGLRWAQLRDLHHQHLELCGLFVELRVEGAGAETLRSKRKELATDLEAKANGALAGAAVGAASPPKSVAAPVHLQSVPAMGQQTKQFPDGHDGDRPVDADAGVVLDEPRTKLGAPPVQAVGMVADVPPSLADCVSAERDARQQLPEAAPKAEVARDLEVGHPAAKAQVSELPNIGDVLSGAAGRSLEAAATPTGAGEAGAPTNLPDGSHTAPEEAPPNDDSMGPRANVNTVPSKWRLKKIEL